MVLVALMRPKFKISLVDLVVVGDSKRARAREREREREPKNCCLILFLVVYGLQEDRGGETWEKEKKYDSKKKGGGGQC